MEWSIFLVQAGKKGGGVWLVCWWVLCSRITKGIMHFTIAPSRVINFSFFWLFGVMSMLLQHGHIRTLQFVIIIIIIIDQDHCE